MAAVLKEVADSLATLLNASDFQTFITAIGIADTWTAERSYGEWDDQLEGADGLRVDVVPVTHERSDIETRGSVTYLTAVDIGVRKKFAAGDADASNGRIDVAEIDRLVWLVERIHEYFCKDLLTNTDESPWQDCSIRIPYHRKHLREWRQFTGIVRLKFRTDRALA